MRRKQRQSSQVWVLFLHLTLLDRVNSGDRINHEVNSAADKSFLGRHATLRRINPERDQKPTGLIVMDGISVNQRYFPFSFTPELSHLRGYHGSASASTKNKQFFHSINPNVKYIAVCHEKVSLLSPAAIVAPRYLSKMVLFAYYHS